MKFDYVIGNPPYQKESEGAISKSNGQKPMTNIFHFFQEEADKIASKCSILIYPGGRWIHQSGKGLKQFGLKQINDPKLAKIVLYPDSTEVFPSGDASLSDGISIVVKKTNKKASGFQYVYRKKGKELSIETDNPGDQLMPLDPHDLPISQKIQKIVESNKWKFMHESILPRSLFGIESSFAEEHPALVRKDDGTADFDKGEIRLLTNDKAGKAGRATWFITDRDNIPNGQRYINQWQVVVSSANAGGQKRDNQIEIIDNHSAFGRSRLALGSFMTQKEAEQFYAYLNTYLIRYAFLLTDESLSSLGKRVPDLRPFDEHTSLDFTRPLDEQIEELFELTAEEKEYIHNRVDKLRENEK